MVMRTHRGGGSCWAEAAIMFANATDIIGHGPPGTWPKQLTTTSAPVTTVVTSFEDSASPTTTVSSLESLSESLAGLRIYPVAICIKTVSGQGDNSNSTFRHLERGSHPVFRPRLCQAPVGFSIFHSLAGVNILHYDSPDYNSDQVSASDRDVLGR